MRPEDTPDKGKCKTVKRFLRFPFLVLNFNSNLFWIESLFHNKGSLLLIDTSDGCVCI